MQRQLTCTLRWANLPDGCAAWCCCALAPARRPACCQCCAWVAAGGWVGACRTCRLGSGTCSCRLLRRMATSCCGQLDPQRWAPLHVAWITIRRLLADGAFQPLHCAVICRSCMNLNVTTICWFGEPEEDGGLIGQPVRTTYCLRQLFGPVVSCQVCRDILDVCLPALWVTAQRYKLHTVQAIEEERRIS